MEWDRHRDRRARIPLLHHVMAASLTDGNEPVFFQNAATSDPETIRSLPNRNLNLRNKDFFVEPPLHFR